MNNPLDRKMFRQAGMSKQPMGILASSPELMTTAQKAMMSGQPVTAQVGTSVNTRPYTQANYPLSYVMPQLGLNSPKPDLYGKNSPKYGGYRTDKTVARDEAKFRKNAGAQIEGPGIIPVEGPETFRVTQPNVDEFTDYKAGSRTLEDPNITGETLINKKNKEILDNKKKEETKVIEPEIKLDLKTTTIDKKALKNKLIPPSAKKAIKQKGEELKIAISESDLSEGSESALKTKGNAFDKYLKTIEDYKKSSLNMGELKDAAVEQSGFDPDDKSQGAEERKDAFWMSLMKAGLAIASGESSNTMQNVAKGLGFGLEGYGKDIKDITAQERENKKEYYSTLRTLVTDEKSAIAAEQLLKVNLDQYNAKILSTMQGQERDIASRELIASKDRELRQVQHDLNVITKFAKIDIQVEKLDMLSTDMYNKNEIASKDFLQKGQQWTKNYELNVKKHDLAIKSELEKMKQFDVSLTTSLFTKEAKQALSLGFGTFNTETGNIDFANDADKQKHDTFVRKLTLLAHSKKTSPNLKFEEVKSVAAVGNAGGIDFNQLKITSDDGKLNAALIWSGQFKEQWDNTLKIKADSSSMTDSYLSADDERVKKARRIIQDNFVKAISPLANGGFSVNKRK